MAADRPRRRITQPCLVCRNDSFVEGAIVSNASVGESIANEAAFGDFLLLLYCFDEACLCPVISIVRQLFVIDHFNTAIETRRNLSYSVDNVMS